MPVELLTARDKRKLRREFRRIVRVDDEHVLTLIEAVHRTDLDTVHVLTFDTAFIDDVGQLSLLPTRPKAISVVEFIRDHFQSTAP